MIRRLLIANRGEIACRIIRTAHSLGIETVLAASDADLDSVPARLADRVVKIGPPQPAKSYLSVGAIIAAAEGARCDAIHPGYGFLSEKAALARACRDAGVIFIGATEEQLLSAGDKWRAREIATAAGLPVVPGGMIHSAEEARALIADIGMPALVKAVGGGGGRGMKLIRDAADADATIALAMAEADAAFGDARVYVERFIERGRHVEVQLLGDGTNVIHLGDRDCSIQRRYQKLIEEAPAPNLPPALQSRLREAAVAYGKALGYRGLGTVEFLVDDARGEFYFLEMNARIQVEHPVTEAITGLDLVAEQIAVAEGRRIKQDDVAFAGHAIEFRINAEDAGHDFRPSPGTVTSAVFPAGESIRVDTHIEVGASVPPFYDSLLAKIIVHGATRGAAIDRARNALADCRIEGVATNLAMHRAVLEDAAFRGGGVATNWFPHFWAVIVR
ncbi:MAG TPA: biotin carboxylase N-terminal domain-containing protein [Rhizomicrobium sp.]|jgi:acetyl-CoA carboxylase biotin carboxylase subunit